MLHEKRQKQENTLCEDPMFMNFWNRQNPSRVKNIGTVVVSGVGTGIGEALSEKGHENFLGRWDCSNCDRYNHLSKWSSEDP